MDLITVIKVLFITLTLTVLSEATCHSPNDTTNTITIGLIGNGSAPVYAEKTNRHGYQFVFLWHFIHTMELYDMFQTIKALDDDNHVDAIIIFDYDIIILNMPQLLETKHKKLIQFGRPMGHAAATKNALFKITDTCARVLPMVDTIQEPYCSTEFNSSSISDISNDVSFTSLISTTMTNLVAMLKWKSVWVIHENATETEISEMVDKLSMAGVMFVIYNIDHIHNFHDTLLQMYDNTVRFNKEINVVVLCGFACTLKILKTANEFDGKTKHIKTLLKKFSSWLVAVHDHEPEIPIILEKCADDIDNIVTISIPKYGNADKQVLDDFLDDTFNKAYTWYSNNKNANVHFPDVLLNCIEQEAKTFDPVSKCKGFYIDTLLWKDDGRRFSTIGHVDLSGQIVLDGELFPNTKFGFNQRRLCVSTLSYGPFVNKTVVNGTDVYKGMAIDMLLQLARTLNFTYTLTEPEDGKWGTYIDKDKKNFNGLVGQLQREECDVVAAPLGVQADREEVIDFAYPFFHDYTTVITKKPDPNKSKWRTLINPFKWHVLIALGIALAVVTIIAHVIEKYNPYYGAPENVEARANGGFHNLHDAFWYMYGALLCQGGVHLPDSVAGRTFISSWWLFCIIVVGIYCGNLIAFLTVTKERPPFNTLEEMISAKGSMKWGVLGGSVWEITFLTSSNPLYSRIGKEIREYNKTDPTILHKSPSFHLDRVTKGNYAWIGDKTLIEIKMSQECDLIKTKQEFLPMKYAYAFTSNSPYTQIFSNQIMKIHEGGLIHIWKRKWWPKANFCRSNTVTEAKSITLRDVQSAFYVCTIGIFFGSVSFISECLISYCKKRRKKSRGRSQCSKSLKCKSVTRVGSFSSNNNNNNKSK